RLTRVSGSWRTGMSVSFTTPRNAGRGNRGDSVGSIYRHDMLTASAVGSLPPLFERRLAPPQRLDSGAALLALDAALLRRLGRLGCAARYRCHRWLPDQLDQPLARVRAVALLGAVGLRDQHQHAVLGHALAS